MKTKILALALLGVIISLQASDVKTGEQLYKKCASCHGLKAEKKALGKSMIINKMSEEEIIEAIKNYKSGKRNMRGMGIIMKGQTATLNENDFKSLASYIKSIK